MAVDNGFPTYEDNAGIYRFYAALTLAQLCSRFSDESITYSYARALVIYERDITVTINLTFHVRLVVTLNIKLFYSNPKNY